MKIERIEIRNFRSFRQFDHRLAGDSVFVIGENGGGKTSLLVGIARALGRDLSFTRADFGNPADPIELRVTLKDLDTEQRGVFGNYVEFTGATPLLTMETRAIWNAASEEADTEHGYTRRVGSRSTREERDAIPLQWLPSYRDAGRMLQLGIGTNLMGQLLETLPIQQSLNDAIDQIQQASDVLASDPVLQELLNAARNYLAGILPDVATDAFSLGVSAITPRDLLRQLELTVTHGGEPIAVARQSSGIAQLAIFVFAIVFASRDSGRILLVDEPELSLHPQSQRALMKALGALQCQTLVATHSASLLDRADPRSVGRLRRSTTGVDLARPSSISAHDAGRLARFTSPQTAEAFFARSVVLVEGVSDQLALEAVAERRGRNLDAEGITIVPVAGARSFGAYLQLFGPLGFQLNVAGLCDEAEELVITQALHNAGVGTTTSRLAREALGFYVCVADLEDELIRAVGPAQAEQLIIAHGDQVPFQNFQAQPANRTMSLHDQLRGFLRGGSRKVEYAPLFVDAMDMAVVPSPFDGVLSRV